MTWNRYIATAALLFPGMVLCAEDNAAAFAVLEQKCVSCHNAHDKKGDVVLDRSPLVIDDLELILDSVSGKSPDMPKERDALSASEIAALEKWVKAGGKIPGDRVLKDTYVPDRQWWSLTPLVKPEVPEAGRGVWGRNDIDRFVFAKLEEKGLTPSSEADPQTLIRRLTYDLTGLPPTPEAVRDFLAASRSDPDKAYEALVDRLLASPRYGEQWARHWLDVARYGESHGYDKDKARFNAWPYRDYVIRSFNEDKPWTRFVKEQVAGDVLWPNDPDGVIALGFVAAGPWDFIAHQEVGEKKLDGRIAKHLDRDDMVSVVFNAFMSTTVQCAQCHNHKFDPVSMEDYYRLHTIFAAVDRRDRVYDLDPAMITKRAGLESEIAVLEKKVKAVADEMAKEGGESFTSLQAKVAELKKKRNEKSTTVPEHGYHSAITSNQKEEKWFQLELSSPVEVAGIRLIGSHDDYNGIGAGFGFPLRYKIETASDATFETDVRMISDFTGADVINPGTTPVSTPVEGKVQYVRVTATRLAERKNDYIFALGEIQLLDASGNNVAAGAAVTAKDSIEATSRWTKTNLIDGKFASSAGPELSAELAAREGDLQTLLAKLETPERIKRRTDATAERDKKKKELAELPQGKLVYTLSTDFKSQGNVIPTKGKPRPIHLLYRGDLRTPGDEMVPGVPALWAGVEPTFALAEGHTEGDRRVALAKYLTAPDNPILWRSIANRIWLGHMGRGIVDSPNDFGRMGMKPTHPELLDLLAARYRETESMKDLHKLIVMSSTYRQVSSNTPDKATIDGSNEYYWRMNRRKLRAEELRDSILATAGVLDLKMGGPSFRDFKFKDDHTPKFWYHLHDPNDPDTHRRTIYRFIARSQTQPFLTTLDCADPSQMVAKRDETTTALQALVLMNNPFMTAMAEHFAKNSPDVKSAIWKACGRAPTGEELELFESYKTKHGWPATCRLIFNLNEFAYLD